MDKDYNNLVGLDYSKDTFAVVVVEEGSRMVEGMVGTWVGVDNTRAFVEVGSREEAGSYYRMEVVAS